MATWHVQRTNMSANPPRFEWLRAKPDFYAAGATLPNGTIAQEDTVDAKWTWEVPAFVATLPGEVSGWRNGNPPRDFAKRARAEKWAALIGDGATPVRMGEPDAEEVVDPAVEALARLREARRAYREAVAAGQDDGL